MNIAEKLQFNEHNANGKMEPLSVSTVVEVCCIYCWRLKNLNIAKQLHFKVTNI